MSETPAEMLNQNEAALYRAIRAADFFADQHKDSLEYQQWRGEGSEKAWEALAFALKAARRAERYEAALRAALKLLGGAYPAIAGRVRLEAAGETVALAAKGLHEALRVVQSGLAEEPR